MRILCFGDSNTYGYDPRGFVAGRYDRDRRWPDILAKLTGHEVLNDSMNGRPIPRHEMELKLFDDMLERLRPDFLVIFLGTNDVVTGASAGETAERMKALLNRVPEGTGKAIIAPPTIRKGVWVEDEHIIGESALLSGLYRTLARERGILFADGESLSISYDGVHLSEEGHMMLANRMYDLLKQAPKGEEI